MGNRKQVAEIIDSLAPERIRETIINLLADSIRIKIKTVKDTNIPLGYSKIGGFPDLPDVFVWPEWKNEPLSFIAQINLAEIGFYDTAGLLPKSGLIYFFYEAEEQPSGLFLNDRGGWRVFYYDGGLVNLSRRTPPEKLPDYNRFNSGVFECSVETTIPSWESIYIKNLKLSSEEKDTYMDIEEKVGEENDIYNGNVYRVLGYPDMMQGEMQTICQLLSNGFALDYDGPLYSEMESIATDWTLLLQIDSDEELGMIWEQEGRIYFWIKREDLAKRDFNKIWMVLQYY